MKLVLGLGRRLYFSPLGLEFSSFLSFFDIPGTVISVPPFQAISVLSESFVTSFSSSVLIGDSFREDGTSRLVAGLGFILFSFASRSSFFVSIGVSLSGDNASCVVADLGCISFSMTSFSFFSLLLHSSLFVLLLSFSVTEWSTPPLAASFGRRVAACGQSSFLGSNSSYSKSASHEMVYRSSCCIIIDSSGCTFCSLYLSSSGTFGTNFLSLMRC